jgi:hypothetical protein
MSQTVFLHTGKAITLFIPVSYCLSRRAHVHSVLLGVVTYVGSVLASASKIDLTVTLHAEIR